MEASLQFYVDGLGFKMNRWWIPDQADHQDDYKPDGRISGKGFHPWFNEVQQIINAPLLGSSYLLFLGRQQHGPRFESNRRRIRQHRVVFSTLSTAGCGKADILVWPCDDAWAREESLVLSTF
jgi:hypothetical protein